ncbi:Retroviral-like aspartic protease 1, partial [Frankliniella fusca]
MGRLGLGTKAVDVEVLGDGRLYVPINIYGVQCFGLLDSGATVSTIGGKAWHKITSFIKIFILGGESWERLQRSDVKLMECSTKHVKVANGQACPVLGRVDAPVVLDGLMKVCSFLVVPDIKQEVILGLDFWRRYGLLPDVVKGTCILAEANPPE